MWDRIPSELRRYLWIEGRSTRREWWRIEIIAIASYWFVGNGAAVVAVLHDEPPLLPGPVRLLLGLLMLWINIASTVRRLHDRNKSGWWSLLYLFPVLGILWHFIECGLLPPRNQGNRYGPPAQEPPSPFERLSASLHQALNPNAMPPMTLRQPMQSEPTPAAPAPRASTRAARPTRTIGPAPVSAVNRTRSPNKLVFAIVAAVAIALLATTLLPPLVTAVGVMQDAPVFRK
jgi:uncharacterized membrane protein YhaH (DUF805 family)